MKKYSVVGFICEDGHPVEVIPSTWLISDDICLWPYENDSKKLKSMILKCAPPNNNWPQIQIKIYGKSSSFMSASKKAEQALLLSSLGSDSSEDEYLVSGKRISKLPLRYKHFSSDEDDSQCLLENPPQKNSQISKNARKGKKSSKPTPELDGSQSLLENASKRKREMYSLPMPPPEHFTTRNVKVSLENDENMLPVNSTTVHDANILQVYEEVAGNKSQGTVSPNKLEEDSYSFLHTASSGPEDSVLEKVLKHLVDIKRENKLLRKEVRVLREIFENTLQVNEHPNVVAGITKIDSEEFQNLPLSSMDELQKLEDDISNNAMKATSLQVSK